MAIADQRTFAAAAQVVGLTQSAVSLQIKALESELGVILFDRTRRPPVLNADGRALVDRAREIIDLADQLTQSFRPDSMGSVLALGAIPTTLTGVLPATLGRLCRKMSGLRIRLSGGLSHELERRVHVGDLDVALVTEPEYLQPTLTWRPFAAEPLMVIAPEGCEGETDEELLTAMPFIRFKRFAWASRIIDSHLRERGISVDPMIEIDSLDGINMLVANGLGVSIVPRRHVDEPFPEGVRVVPFGTPPIVRTIGLIERSDTTKSMLTSALHEELVGMCGDPGVSVKKRRKR
ncbi:MAG: LysR family transcriptional regulator [Rhodospirillaceae bacterium]|nr:LysR family transcriptional regulator [Rhodospirillaceae bacterium]